MLQERLQAGPAPVSGNGAILSVRKQRDAWLVRFMSEPRTSPQPLWFHVECGGAGGLPVRFIWENASGCLGLGNPVDLGHVRPVVRLDDGPWQRVGRVSLVRPPHGGRAVTFETPSGNCRTAAAFCYPYGPADLEATLQEIGGPWHACILGLTGKGRPLVRLEAPSHGAARKGPAAYVIARQHAGETPGSWVLDGLLRAVAAAGPADRLPQVAWRVVPFIDLDGVVAGDYGKDAPPVDFNRSWNQVTMRPEALTVQRDMQQLAGAAGPRLVLDLHAPAGGERQFYQFVSHPGRPEEQRAAQLSFASLLEARFPGLPPETLVRHDGDPARWPSRWDDNHTVGNWAWDHLSGTLGVTIETTYLRLPDGPYLEPADYRELGRKVAEAAAAWLLAQRPA